MNIEPLGIVHDASELRKLIAENPDLPICVLVGREAASDEFAYTYCTDVRAYIGEILDCEVSTRECVITDRDDLKDALDDLYCDEYADLSDDEYDKAIEAKIAEYEPFWKKAIVVYADN